MYVEGDREKEGEGERNWKIVVLFFFLGGLEEITNQKEEQE